MKVPVQFLMIKSVLNERTHEKCFLCTFSKFPAETESLPSEYARKFPTLFKDHYMLRAQRKWRKTSCTFLALPMMNCNF